MKVGVYGGTFDPIHLGHLVVGEFARDQLGLDEVLFVPAAIPPHKQRPGITAGRMRLEMLELAIAGNPCFSASAMEIERQGVSYTVDTLKELGERRPGDDIHLILGADSLADLPRWHRAEEICARARVAVACRPGNLPLDFSVLESCCDPARIREIAGRVIEIPLLDIASRQLRERVAVGRSIRYLVPPAVLAYIEAKRLYVSRVPQGEASAERED